MKEIKPQVNSPCFIFSAFVGGTLPGFADMFSQLQKTIGATQHVREIMQEKGEDVHLLENTVVQQNNLLKGEVEFTNVMFSYPSRKDVQVLRDINLKVKSGEQIAIVGPSGAGKSTVTSLLLQFYQPDAGTILFDGKPATSFPLSELRNQMALVPQDVMLLGKYFGKYSVRQTRCNFTGSGSCCPKSQCS